MIDSGIWPYPCEWFHKTTLLRMHAKIYTMHYKKRLNKDSSVLVRLRFNKKIYMIHESSRNNQFILVSPWEDGLYELESVYKAQRKKDRWFRLKCVLRTLFRR